MGLVNFIVIINKTTIFQYHIINYFDYVLLNYIKFIYTKKR
jgi:hypothetical protein